MKQLTLNLFKGEKVEKEFDLNIEIAGKRHVYARRDADGTFLMIGSINFLGKPSGAEFRFHDKNFQDKDFKDIVEPELANMSLSRIKEFANHIIENLELGKYAWNYEHRAKDYSSIINAEENMAHNFASRAATSIMVEYHKLNRELETV